MRFHPENEQDLACARALLHTTRKVLPGLDAEEKRVARLQAQYERLCRKQPQKLKGRHVFVKDLTDLSKERHAAGQSSSSSTQIIAKHGEHWVHMGQQRR